MRPRVAIIYNDPSPSRYDALAEAKAVLGVIDEVEAVYRALTELGYFVVRVPLSPPLEQVRKRLKGLDTDLVFNLFEGFGGYPETEAVVADMLSELGPAYTGCPGAALALALNKARTKAVLEASGIDTPVYQVLTPETLNTFQLGYPCIVKPCGEDASHGLSEASLVHNFASLEKQVTLVSQHYGGRALVEEFIDGREFNATVLGNTVCTVLPISEIAYSLPPGMPKILTFAAKWESDSLYFKGTNAVCPADIGADLERRIAETALAAFKLLGCQGYARVDMRLSTGGRLSVIEVNPNPDISPSSGAVRQAKAAGMSYTQFAERILLLALER